MDTTNRLLTKDEIMKIVHPQLTIWDLEWKMQQSIIDLETLAQRYPHATPEKLYRSQITKQKLTEAKYRDNIREVEKNLSTFENQVQEAEEQSKKVEQAEAKDLLEEIILRVNGTIESLHVMKGKAIRGEEDARTTQGCWEEILRSTEGTAGR